MQHVVTGLDQEGKSCVVSRREVDTEPATGPFEIVASTDDLPPRLPEMLVDQPPAMDVGIEQAGTKWLIVKWRPGVEAPLHRTDTLDYDIVVSGLVTLTLEEGEVELHPGDSVVIPGVLHGWRAGPDGGVSSTVMVALDRS
ncbi:MAG TPA: cupin domain-containing protein [Acidimicrobiia bacterium]|jgi:mannose-6-phosphate isomerase-like protein (cupin superfamily)